VRLLVHDHSSVQQSLVKSVCLFGSHGTSSQERDSESKKMTHEYDPEKFGAVLATLQAQTETLTQMRADITRLFMLVDAIKSDQAIHRRRSESSKPDWLELIVGSVLGAVAYFILAHFIEK
jgi:hypothetical protein